MANIFEFLSKDGNITPEKARKSRQMKFHDKTAYVWCLRYRWDPSLSMNPVRRFAHFMPPCIGVTPSPDVYAKLSGKRLCNMTEGGKSLFCAHSNETLWPLCMTQALTLRLLKGWWTNSKKELFLVPIAIRLAGSRPFLWQRPLLNGRLRSMRWMNIWI